MVCSDNILGEFEVNLLPLEGSQPDPVTMNWFETEASEALEYCRQNQFLPSEAMNKFGDWLLELPKPRIMAAHPAPIDFAWVNWYILKFLRNRLDKYPYHQPFFHHIPAFDIKSYATADLKKDYPRDLPLHPRSGRGQARRPRRCRVALRQRAAGSQAEPAADAGGAGGAGLEEAPAGAERARLRSGRRGDRRGVRGDEEEPGAAGFGVAKGLKRVK